MKMLYIPPPYIFSSKNSRKIKKKRFKIFSKAAAHSCERDQFVARYTPIRRQTFADLQLRRSKAAIFLKVPLNLGSRSRSRGSENPRNGGSQNTAERNTAAEKARIKTHLRLKHLEIRAEQQEHPFPPSLFLTVLSPSRGRLLCSSSLFFPIAKKSQTLLRSDSDSDSSAPIQNAYREKKTQLIFC